MRQGPDPRPMVKGWLSQVLAKLRSACPQESKKVDFPVGVEVTGPENTSWVILLDQGKIVNRTKEEVKVTLFVPQNNLRVLSMNLRYKAWRESFEAGTVKVSSEDAAQTKMLQSLAAAAEKVEA